MNRFLTACIIPLLSMGLALSGCSGGSTSGTSLPNMGGATTVSTQNTAAMHMTVERASIKSKTDGRNTLDIPASTQSISIDSYSGALAIPQPGTLFIAPSGRQPTATSCVSFPSGQSSINVTAQIPIGLASVVVGANTGICSGQAASGTIVSQAAGTGTATAAGGDLGVAFFNSSTGVELTDIALPANSTGIPIILTQPYTDTKITLSQGQNVSIGASGTMNWYTGSCDGTCLSNPVGYLCNRSSMTVPSLFCYSLIGKIGNDGTPFAVGTSLQFIAPASGELFLGVNDDFYGDNTGSWYAVVTI
jgi:hypothetical protein